MTASPRFLTLSEVAEIMNTSTSQVYALVRRGDLPAIKMGGRGQWRVEKDRLEDFIAQMYDDTRRFVEAHPFTESDATGDEAFAED
ncbi:MAG: helix-turn-helix domain-containing protein [Nocardioides sp.]